MEFDSRWDSQLWSVIYTGFGTIPNPAWRNSGRAFDRPTLTSRFMDALESRFCRRNYQERLSNLEKALRAAVETHGEDKVASAGTSCVYIKLYGETIADGLQKAGFKLEDPVFFDRMLVKTKRFLVEKDQKPLPSALPPPS